MMKTILIPIVKHDASRATLQTALLLARKFDSYMEGFSLRFGISEFVAIDVAGAIPVEQFVHESQEEAKLARTMFEAFMQEQAIPHAATDSGPASLSYGWLDQVPQGEGFIGGHGRVFDVIVLARPDANTIGLYSRALESGLFESGRPILISPPTPPERIGNNVLLAWNSSTEQARVTALGMPILRKAEQVTVLTVIGSNNTVAGPSAEQMVTYLRRNGVTASALEVPMEGRETGAVILDQAAKLGCDLLVKGAYTQSRLRQMIFGGATRHILENTNLPVLMAH